MTAKTAEYEEDYRALQVIEAQLDWPVSYATLQSPNDIAKQAVGKADDVFTVGDDKYFAEGTEENEVMREAFFGLMDLAGNLLSQAGVRVEQLLETDGLHVSLYNIPLPEETYPGHSVTLDGQKLVGKPRTTVSINGVENNFVALNYQIVEGFEEANCGTFVDSTTFFVDTSAVGSDQVPILRTSTSRTTSDVIRVGTPTWDTALHRVKEFAQLATDQNLTPQAKQY